MYRSSLQSLIVSERIESASCLFSIKLFSFIRSIKIRNKMVWFLCLMAYQLFFRLFNAKAILLEEL